ncbi:MAG: hypothetical protein GY707_02065 [Desulfobacteraceae bacterium]|nr:hypothetical protein [Desulfobacteraceae bacterium]
MRKIFIIFVLLFILPNLGGCSSKDSADTKPHEKKTSQTISNDKIKKIILKEFRKWEGTPHKMGGYSKKGIDCSGFANYMYKKLFNIEVPRSTKLFLKQGVKIKKSKLKPGDLVIFSPPTYPRHVGIYVGNDKFIHASTSKGVMMSDLKNPYWLKYYLMSRRIFN